MSAPQACESVTRLRVATPGQRHSSGRGPDTREPEQDAQTHAFTICQSNSALVGGALQFPREIRKQAPRTNRRAFLHLRRFFLR